MSGVGITGLIKPLNGGAFPVWEDIDGFGGCRSVATNAARDAIPANFRKEGMLVYSQRTQCCYSLNPDLTTWSLVWASQKLGTQASWFVNQATGNDNNDGLTSGTALATLTELSQRLCPFGALRLVNQSVTISVAAGNYVEELRLNMDFLPTIGAFGAVVSVQGALSSVTDTLTAVVATSPSTSVSGQLTVASNLFSNKCRIRAVTGANAGAICYSTGLNAGANNTYISQPVDYNAGTAPNFANGITVAVDTLLTTIKIVHLTSSGRGYLEVKDLKISSGVVSQASYQSSAVNFWGCAFSAGVVCLSHDNLQFWNCTTASASFAGPGNHTFEGHVFYGVANIGRSLPAIPGLMELNIGITIDGGQVVVQNGSLLIDSGSFIEGVHGAGAPAISVVNGSKVYSVGQLWGRSVATSNFSFAISLGSGATWISAVGVSGFVFPATNPINMTGHTLAWGAVPITYPRAACTFGLDPDSAAVAITT